MHSYSYILQDGANGKIASIVKAIVQIASATQFTFVRGSVAYATTKGCKELALGLDKGTNAWEPAQKRWLTSIDFGQTSPEAIVYLMSLENSEVRIPDGHFVLNNKLRPRLAFHPKTFVFENLGDNKAYEAAMFCGSANLTHGGLYSNAEHMWATRFWGAQGKEDQSVDQAIKEFDIWWSSVWVKATPVNDAFLTAYKSIYNEKIVLQDAEEISLSFSGIGPVEVESAEGIGWATARHFWIETQELYKNWRDGRPGNQLDCRRGTRIYFGFPSTAVAKNTILGDVYIKFEGKARQKRSVRFGNNAMDKVNLPIPVTYGPPNYDNSVLNFERVSPGSFELKLGKPAEVTAWKKKSKSQGMIYSFTGGRQYGFYN